MKKLVVGLVPVVMAVSSFAQPVFTYGNKAVSKDEFIRAFNKNPGTITDRKKALKEYLDLYINFKLKVQAAYDAKLNEDANQQYELDNFNHQVAENLINEEANVDRLVKEAFLRSQKDIHLAQVFIEVPAGKDTVDAFRMINAAYKALKEGKEFGKVSQEFSNDGYTKQTAGDMGYVTAFTLPYQFENVAYSLGQNEYSQPFKSKIGYHIFKNLGERKALGRRRVSQILFALPPGSSDARRSAMAKTADSVYNLLVKGIAFDAMVNTFSNDLNSVNNHGEMAEFGVGDFNPQFEQVAFSLKNPGEISRPFASNYGYHILKLIEAKPVTTDEHDPLFYGILKDKISRDERLADARKLLAEKHLSLIKYKPAAYNKEDLFRYTDSMIAGKKPGNIKTINEKTVLFSFAKQQVTAGDWLKYVKAVRPVSTEMSQKPYSDLLKEYVKVTGEEYYRDHLGDYNKQYQQQVNEFKDANLLFGIMDKNVWSRANLDSAGLLAYYQKNKNKYQWGPSADALIITGTNEEVANAFKQKLQGQMMNWRAIADSFAGRLTVDSGRYELAQLPVEDKTAFTAVAFTSPVKNPTDGSYTFNYIFRQYPGDQQRSFEDARGIVISDYQQVVEDRWIAELKKKYPVKVNAAVFNGIN